MSASSCAERRILATHEHVNGVQILTDVSVFLHDALEGNFHEVSVTLLASNMARQIDRQQVSCRRVTSQYSGFPDPEQQRMYRSDASPAQHASRHERPTGPDADPQRCNTEGVNTASQQASTPERSQTASQQIHAGSHLASKRRMRTRQPPHESDLRNTLIVMVRENTSGNDARSQG